MTPRVLLAPTLDLALSVRADVTIEAEFGSAVVCGALATFAHHVPSASHNPSPCSDPRVNASCSKDGTILLSHVDLDSFGGALRAMWACPMPEHPFWAVAGAVDVRGPHRLTQSMDAADIPEDQRAGLADLLRAFWAWGRSRPRLPRDVVSDVTAEVLAARDVLRALLDPSGPVDTDDTRIAAHWIQAGRDALAAEDTLEGMSFRWVVEHEEVRVVVREADQFVAALHRAGNDTNVAGTVSRDVNTGAITIALADPVPGVSCAAVARSLWGPDAGGHAGIAGSPRGQSRPTDDLDRAAVALCKAVSEARDNPGAAPPPTQERWIPAWRAKPLVLAPLGPEMQSFVDAVDRPAWAREVHVTAAAGSIQVIGIRETPGYATGMATGELLASFPGRTLPIPPWATVVDDGLWEAVHSTWMTHAEADAAWAAFVGPDPK